MPLGFAASSVYIDDIGYRLEREERDADRQRDLRDLKPSPERGIDIADGKIQIFENEYDQKIEKYIDAEYDSRLPVSAGGPSRRYEKSRRPVDRNGQHHYQDEFRLSPGIKKQARQTQKDILQQSGPSEKPIIDQYYSRQKCKQKSVARK